MKRIFLIPPLLLGSLLAACGGSSDSGSSVAPTLQPSVQVQALPAGSYNVALGSDSKPAVGQYLAAADGSRLLVVNDDNELAQTLYKQAAGGAWQSVPAASAPVSITLLRSDATSPATVDLARLAGRYVAQVQGGGTAVFTLAADGSLSAAGGSCQLSGKTGVAALPGSVAVNLVLSGCGSLPAAVNGVLLVDAAYAPARFRLLADDGKQVVDLWAYAE
ncbi:hypothetical protein SAMN02745857_00117 [Andreprevotia lacus DSM 23236]|jgi:hypothetical protein|uniref:Lipoprotein n=1 Tax=Andreprevotia lacus DSM 23236 TaxID=1121001 RepID=A0A1W1WXL7_9NEIS|nr:hypothetical protein [Andreprevotia lacus]SMC16168.1 hypothetical protein SAMN02745857_00117 [Andreprevotia lacus DSM 23236]